MSKTGFWCGVGGGTAKAVAVFNSIDWISVGGIIITAAIAGAAGEFGKWVFNTYLKKGEDK